MSAFLFLTLRKYFTWGKKIKSQSGSVIVLGMHFPFTSHQRSEAIPKDFHRGRENCTAHDSTINASSGRWETKV